MNKRFLFNLQLFAEEVDGSEQNDAEETNPVDNGDTEENVEFEDGASKEETEESKEDSKSTEDKPVDNKTDDTKKKNAEAAQRRIAERQKRQEEARKKELEAEKRKSYVDGMKASTGGVNKFTNKPIEDEADVEEYEIMLKLSKDGKDPIEDYPQAVKDMKRAEKQKALDEEKAKAETEKALNDDVDEFVKKYGAETAQTISSDAEFMKFANDLIGTKPSLNTIYEKFLSVKAEIEKKAEEKALEKDARRMSSSGSLGKNNETPKSFGSMSDSDFDNFRAQLRQKI